MREIKVPRKKEGRHLSMNVLNKPVCVDLSPNLLFKTQRVADKLK